jgi:hypothetical protein
VDQRLAEAVAGVLPEWRLLHAESGDGCGLLPEIHGEKNAVALRFRSSGPIVLGREVTFPARGRPQLRVRFGNELQHTWNLEVRFRGAVVWSGQFTRDSHPQPWKNVTVNLQQLAGSEGWLTVRATLPRGGEAVACWKSLELVW